MIHAITAGIVRFVFTLVGYATLALGVAATITWCIASSTLLSGDFTILSGFALKVGVTSLVAGLMLAYLSHSKRPLLPNESDSQTTPSESTRSIWLTLFALSLTVIPFVALAQMRPLAALWHATGDLATRWNLVERIGGAKDYSGLIGLPVMAILIVPLAESIMAAAFIFCSVCLLPLLAFRSRFFPRVLLMSLLLQFALFLDTSYAVNLDIVGRVRTAMEQESLDTRDTEAGLFIVWSDRHQATVGPIASVLTWTLVGYAIWLPVVLASDRFRTIVPRDLSVTAGFSLPSNLCMTQITVDGKKYGSVDEMPVDVRQRYEKILATIADGDKQTASGFPDALSQTVVRQEVRFGMASPAFSPNRSMTCTTFEGKTYHGVDEMPADVRERYEKLLAAIAEIDRPPAGGHPGALG